MSEKTLRKQLPKPPLVPPPLEGGDRLTRVEFERRYSAMPSGTKAELVEGVVYMPSPVRLERHGSPSRHISTWLGTYEAATPGVIGADNVTVRLDMDNEPQPDAILLIDPACGGQTRISDDDFIEGGPELAVEVASSSVSYDLGDKMHAYRRNSVREYLVWRVLDREFDWFLLREGRYDRLPLDGKGRYCSETFPGLWLDPALLLGGDLAGVLQLLAEGLASPEHAAFVEQLKQRRPANG